LLEVVMRAFLSLLALAGCGLAGYAQGYVAFGNRNPLYGIDAPVFDMDCQTRLAGPAYVAQLYFGDTPGSLQPVGPVLPFRIGAGAGYISGTPTPVSIPGHPELTPVWVQIRVWEAAAGPSYEAAITAGGKYGYSNPVEVILGTGTGPPAVMVGLQSFCLVPEPGPGVLLALGGGPVAFGGPAADGKQPPLNL
jgi:hypothetical protein